MIEQKQDCVDDQIQSGSFSGELKAMDYEKIPLSTVRIRS
jgi:hypothetical protein